jgi:hypothetical protein
VVFFKYFVKSSGQFVSGILPPAQIAFDSNTGTVGFETKYFGQFQAVYISGLVITETREVNSTQGAVKKEAGGESTPKFVRPSCTLSSALKTTTQNPMDLDLVCNKVVAGLSVSSFDITNGAATEFSGEGKTFKLSVMATALGQVSVALKDSAGKDAEGNGTFPETYLYTWQSGSPDDQTPVLPQVAITAPASGDEVESGAVQTIIGTCSPNGASIIVTLDGKTLQSSCTAGAFSVTNTWSVGSGSKTVTATVTAEGGNQNTNSVTINHILALSVVARYTLGQQWTSGLRTANPTESCDGSESLGHDQCFFGGPYRSVAVSGFISCSGLSMTDDQNFFDWTCAVQNGVAIFHSKPRAGTRLGTLLEASAAAPFVKWKANRVVAKLGTVVVGKSNTESAWWSDTLVRLSDTGFQDLTGTHKIFAVTTNLETEGLNLNGDNQALIVMDGASLTAKDDGTENCDFETGEFPGNVPVNPGKCLVASGSQLMLWIEGDFDAKTATGNFDVALFIKYHQGLRLEQATVKRADLFGAELDGIGTEAVNLTSHSNGSGVAIKGQGYSRFRDLRTYNNDAVGLSVESEYGIYNGVRSFSNGNIGIEVWSSNVVISDFIVSNNDNAAIHLPYDVTKTAFLSGLVVANNEDGIELGDDSINNVFANIAVLLSSVWSIKTVGGPNTFSNTAIGHTSSILDVQTSDPPTSVTFVNQLQTQGVNGCNTDNTNLISGCATTSDPALTIINNLDTTGLFQPGSNALHSSGINWSQPLGKFQTIGRSQSTPLFMAAENIGPCNASETGYCSVYDWSILNGYTGQIKAANGVFPATAGQACPVNGNAVLTVNATNFLAGAIEMLGDELGNDNGLCESNEACLFQPNIGAYQGQGSLYPHSCTFTDGTVSGITLWGFSINGAS